MRFVGEGKTECIGELVPREPGCAIKCQARVGYDWAVCMNHDQSAVRLVIGLDADLMS